MIGRLVGTVVASIETSVTLDVSGVGYELNVPLGSLGHTTPGRDGRIVLFVHTHVREDVLELFGFASEVERSVFRLLIGVPNVGPRTALGVLSALPAAELAQAVEEKDLARLTSISGVGKKTAERLVLELRGKLTQVSGLGAANAPRKTNDDASRLLSALTNMGFRQ
ncbi:MAG: Holliday junction branch migration protein RuvA, partial [Polyangiaceae bacterium]